ncbi:MAG: hypothetical protein U0165_19800 [Polyangiaceae bacterium]
MRSLIRWLAVLVALVAIHELLSEWLVRENLVSRLLSPGAHTPWLSLVVSSAFFAVRFATLFVLPGAMAWKISHALFFRESDPRIEPPDASRARSTHPERA